MLIKLTAEFAKNCLLTAMMVIGLCALLVTSPGASASERPQHRDVPDISDTSTPHGNNAMTDMWRDIRMGQPSSVTAPGKSGDILIQSEGTLWQVRRSVLLVNYGAMVLIGVIAIIALYFLVRGRIKIGGGRTGLVIPRFTLIQRVVHWSVAFLVVLLSVSGLVLLVGREALIPIIGTQAFSIAASASMQGHNLFGPLLIPALIAMFVTFVRGNGYRLVDVKWLFKAGGFFGGHASSYKYNLGEKTWFWWAMALGIVLCVSGVAMLFPEITPGRAFLQIANLAHAAAAIGIIAFAIGHIYLGTIGMEGALEGMTKGTVDTNWAKEHHDLWHDEHLDTATDDTVRAEVTAAAQGDALPEGAGE